MVDLLYKVLIPTQSLIFYYVDCFYNSTSIVQKLMIFFFVKDIGEWKILSLKNNIIVKKKRPRIEDENNFQLYLRYFITRILYHRKA